MMETPCGFSTNHSTREVFMTGTPTPPLIGIIDRPGQFMILIGMNKVRAAVPKFPDIDISRETVDHNGF